MRLIILGSGSSGNGYVLKARSGQMLVIEAGCSLMTLKKAINFDISKIISVLSSHVHADHAGHIYQYMQAGLKVFADQPSGKGSKHHNLNPLIGQFTVGEFTVKPFDLVHDVPCHGFLISHEEMGTCMFATDTSEIPYSFSGLNQIMIEANYDQDIMDENVINGTVPVYLRDRVMKSHLSLESCKQFLQDTDMKGVINIVLMHLSNDNSNSVNFANDIKEMTGCYVHIAEKGMEIEFNKNPF